MASDVREMLREFALKKMEELEKEKETKATESDINKPTREKAECATEKKNVDRQDVAEPKSPGKPVDENEQNAPTNLVKNSCTDQSETDSKSAKDCDPPDKCDESSVKETNQKASGIKINIITTKLDDVQDTAKGEDGSASDSSSSSDNDDDDDNDDEKVEGEDVGEVKPWREVPEEGELVDSTDESQVEGKPGEKDGGKEFPEQGSSKSKKKHKKHKKKSKKKKHKKGKEKNKDKENGEKDKSKEKKDKKEKSGKRKHSHRSRSRSKSRSKKHKKRSRSRSTDRSRDHKSHQSSHHPYRSRSRERYRYDDLSYNRQYRDRERDRFDRHHRSNSPKRREKTPVTEFDKAKLLEIAKANAYAQQKAGLLPPNLHLPPPSKEEVASFRAGGKTIDELTSVCKKISEKQQELDSSDDEPVNVPVGSDEDDTPFLHHPFQVKNHPLPIVMNIKNAVQKPVQDKDTLLQQFPVSSGTQHRKKEVDHMDPYGEWVPVEKKDENNGKAESSAGSESATQSNTDSENANKPDTSTPTTTASVDTASSGTKADAVFPKVQMPSVDISTMVSERLQAMRKLQHNPNDVEAMGMMYKANQQIQSWAQAGHKPGQFTGSTDAQLLRPEQLANSNPRAQAWAKKDMFHNTAPVQGGMGMYLLQKMGWKLGEGLGKNNEGSLLPLSLDVKTDRRGLVASGESQKKKAAVPAPVIRDLSGKHPVSALMEICNKRKWPPPEFTLEHDSGPDHKKNFVFKVRVNNQEYQPSVASPNKKNAKAQAATIALQKMGLIPMDYSVPQ